MGLARIGAGLCADRRLAGAVSRWRWRVDRLRGPNLYGDWQPDYETARRDAVRAGMAKNDPEHGFLMDVFTNLEEERAEEPEPLASPIAPPNAAPDAPAPKRKRKSPRR